ncbi:MAG: ribosomal L7Ae/L30e/S12e/Gadd45 family protein [Lachnospiraceae bacterium]|nr:ribosomal L7Ae/L30e/S12e/Gadd45 family protein [Lachnospiraceae bacterium]
MTHNKVLSYLGIAKKGGHVKSGAFMTEEAVKSYNAFLVIIADDASSNTKKKFEDMCKNYEVPCYIYGSSDELGHCIGTEFRMCLAITDEGLSKACIKVLEEKTPKTEESI